MAVSSHKYDPGKKPSKKKAMGTQITTPKNKKKQKEDETAPMDQGPSTELTEPDLIDTDAKLIDLSVHPNIHLVIILSMIC